MGCVGSKPVNMGVLQDNGKAMVDEEEEDIIDSHRLKVLVQLNADVDRILSTAHNIKPQRALFLGTGESGKSTVFKQLKLSYDNGFDTFERFQYSKLIWIETIRTMKQLLIKCEYMDKSGWFQEGPNLTNSELIRSLDVTKEALLAAEQDPQIRTYLNSYTGSSPGILSVKDDEPPPSNQRKMESMIQTAHTPSGVTANRATIGQAIHDLWLECPAEIQELVRAHLIEDMETNAAYFLDNVLKLVSKSYLASDDDILKARIKTTGIVSAQFHIKGSDLIVTDVGGQRMERRKWLYHFDDVTTVLFVVAASEFDQTLVEDSNTNRLVESLDVFEETVNSRWFRAKSVTLFFNKVDIFQRKINHSNYSDHFPDFVGDDRDAEAILQHIESMFRQRIQMNGRTLYVHHTCATDTTSMNFVIGAVTDTILYENLKWAGMI